MADHDLSRDRIMVSYVLTHERLLNMYFWRIHPKKLEFHFYFFNVMLPAFEGNTWHSSLIGWSPASLFCIEEHRRSAYE